MPKLSTHVLDTVRGCPAKGLQLQLWRIEGESKDLLGDFTTNADGRTDKPLLEDAAFLAGEYEIVFFVGDYFRGKTAQVGASEFLNRVPVRFSCDPANGNYHVPLLCSPWAYTTYRGS